MILVTFFKSLSFILSAEKILLGFTPVSNSFISLYIFLSSETYSLTVKAGPSNYYLCTRNGNNFYDVGTNNSYCKNSGFGQPEVISCMPLSEFYNRLGLKRRIVKRRSERSEAYKLVKEHKKVLKNK